MPDTFGFDVNPASYSGRFAGPVEMPSAQEQADAAPAKPGVVEGFVNTFTDALMQETLPAKSVDWAQEQMSSFVDPDFRISEADLQEYHEQYWPALSSALSPEHFEAIKSNLDEELGYKERLEHNGIGGMGAAIAASMLDPTTYLLPVGAGMKWASTGSRMAQAAKAGLVTSTAAAAHMEALRATSQTRTVEDTVHGALFAFGLGGGLRFLFPHISARSADDAPEVAPDTVLREPGAMSTAARADLDAALARAAAVERRVTSGQTIREAAQRRLDDLLGAPVERDSRNALEEASLAAERRATGAQTIEAKLEREISDMLGKPRPAEPTVPDLQTLAARLKEATENLAQGRRDASFGGVQPLDDLQKAVDDLTIELAAAKATAKGHKAATKAWKKTIAVYDKAVKDAQKRLDHARRIRGSAEWERGRIEQELGRGGPAAELPKDMAPSLPPAVANYRKAVAEHGARIELATNELTFANKAVGAGEWELGRARADVERIKLAAEREAMDGVHEDLVRRTLEGPRVNAIGEDTARVASEAADGAADEALDVGKYLDEAVARVGEEGKKSMLGNRVLDSIGTRLITAKSPEVRALGRLLSEIGRGGESIRENTAEALKEVYERNMRDIFVPRSRQVFNEWASRNGINPMSRDFFGAGRSKFHRMVSEELAALEAGRGSVYASVPEVQKMVKVVKELNDAVGALMRRGGVQGAESIDNPYYAPRRWHGVRMLGHDRQYGPGFSVNLIAKGLMQGPAKFEEKEATAIAKAIFRRFTDRAVDATEDVSGLFSLSRQAELRRLLEESGMEKVDIDSIAKRLYPKRATGMSHTQHRLPLDMMAEHNGVRVLDLVDTDLDHTMVNYIRAASGWAALARKGIRSPAEWKSLVDAAKRRIAARGNPEEIAEAKDTMEMLELVQGALVGKPPFSDTTAMRYLRRVTDLTHISALGGMGLTQFGEFGPAVATAGVRNVLREIPMLGKMRKDIMTGRMDDTLFDELRKLGTVVGDDHLLYPPRFRDEEFGLGVVADSRAAQVLDNTLAKGREAVGYLSAQYHMMGMQQKVWNRVLVADLAQQAKGKASSISERRLADMGFDAARRERIVAAIKEHGVWDKDGNLTKMGAAKWDADVLEDLQLGLHRSTNQMFQKASFSEQPRWTYYPVGRLLSQFRTYPITAWEKQLQRQGSMMGFDLETASLLGWSMAFGAASYMAKTYNGSLGLDPVARRKYMKERMSEEAIVAGAVSQIGVASILPDTVGYLAAMTTGVNPLSHTSTARAGLTRQAELDLGDIAPSLGYLNRAARSGATIAQWARGEKPSDSDWHNVRMLLPLNNAVGMAAFFNSIEGR